MPKFELMAIISGLGSYDVADTDPIEDFKYFLRSPALLFLLL